MMFASDSKNVCRHLLNTYKFKIILWVKARPLLLFFTSNVHFSSINWENEKVESWYMPIKA